ncbi:trypco2 family protein [Streptomyces sp. 769]|uniref:trypco2 family protein n=1 Tax=Streptomyces sp. 769 TaxID=1262452 RepID=UPI00057EC683|nr:trypco2 family protein [Streptomyces sp. 769]
MIELASVIRDLRAELEQAITAAEGEALRFELGPVELEVSVALERTAQAGAKVRFWVVESGAEATAGATTTQRIKLALQPTLTGTNAHPFVSGPADAHEQ